MDTDDLMLEKVTARRFDQSIDDVLRAWRSNDAGALADTLDRLDYAARAIDR